MTSQDGNYTPPPLSATTRATIDRIEGDGPKKSFSPRVQKCLAEMPDGVASDFRMMFGKMYRGKGFANLKKWDPETEEMAAKAIRDACLAAIKSGVQINSIADLGLVDAIDAVIARFDKGEVKGQTVGLILARVRMCYRHIVGFTPPTLRARLSYWVKEPGRQRLGHKTPEEYLNGAVAVAAVSDLMASAGQVRRASALLTDASLLACAAEVNARRKEYSLSDLQMMSFRSHRQGAEINLYWRGKDRKNNVPRIGVVQDSRAVDLIKRAIGNRSEGPIFLGPSGRPMTGGNVYESLRRTTLLAFGRAVGPNFLRDAGASESTDPLEMGLRIGSTPRVAEEHYRRPMNLVGLELTRSAMDDVSDD